MSCLTSNWFQKSKTALDVGSTVISVLGVCALSAASLYWLYEPRPLSIGSIAYAHTLEGRPGGTTNVPTVTSIGGDLTDSTVLYKIHLVDSQGNLAYRYPDLVMNAREGQSDEERLRPLGSVALHIPEKLKPGTYTISAELMYQMNPIKTNTIKVELAKLNVGRSDAYEFKKGFSFN